LSFRKSVLGVLVFVHCSLFAQAGHSLPNHPFKLDSEFLRNAGIVRHSDLFNYLIGWNTYTLDDNVWIAVPNSQSHYGDSAWRIIIDEVELNMGLFGVQNINMIPVNLTEVTSIEVISTPEFSGGEILTKGVLKYTTESIEKREYISGSFNIGNETGDPGPHRYTEFSSINIDKIGPDMSVNVAYPLDKWKYTGGIAYRQYFPTDEHIMGRIRRLAIDHPKVKNLTFSSTVRNHLKSRWQWLAAAFYSLDENYIFYSPALTEILAKHHYLQLITQFSIDRKVKAYVSHVQNGLTEQENLLALDPEFMINENTLLVEFIQAGDGYQFVNGLKWHYVSATSADWEGRKDYSRGSFHSGLQYQIAKNIKQQLNVVFEIRDSQVTGNAQLKSSIKNENFLLDINLFSGSIFSKDEQSISFWTEQGYTFFSELGQINPAATGPVKETMSSMDITLSTTQVSWNGSINIYYRYFDDFGFTQQHISYNSETDLLDAANVYYMDVEGAVSGMDMRLQYQFTSNFSQRFDLAWSNVISGDNELIQIWRARPELKLNIISEYYKQKKYSLAFALRFLGESYWNEFSGILDTSNGYYDESVPSFWTADFSFGKSFWHQRLHGLLVIRNITNEPLHSHPVGSHQHMGFFIKVSFKLS